MSFSLDSLSFLFSLFFSLLVVPTRFIFDPSLFPFFRREKRRTRGVWPLSFTRERKRFLSPLRKGERERKQSLDLFLSDCPAPPISASVFSLSFSKFSSLSLKLVPFWLQIPRTGRGGTAAACTAMTHAARRDEAG